MKIRFVYWFWFGLGLAILPLAISCWYINAINPDKTFYLNLIHTLSNGELLIICCAILGVNIGDLFRDETIEKWKFFKFSFLGASFLTALFCVGIYISISTTREVLSQKLITNTSIILLFVTIIVCLCSLLLPKIKE